MSLDARTFSKNFPSSEALLILRQVPPFAGPSVPAPPLDSNCLVALSNEKEGDAQSREVGSVKGWFVHAGKLSSCRCLLNPGLFGGQSTYAAPAWLSDGLEPLWLQWQPDPGGEHGSPTQTPEGHRGWGSPLQTVLTGSCRWCPVLGGTRWGGGALDATPPPSPDLLELGQLVGNVRNYWKTRATMRELRQQVENWGN